MDIRLRDAALVAMYAGEQVGNWFLDKGPDELGEVVLKGMTEGWPVQMDPQTFVHNHDGVDDSPEYKDLEHVLGLVSGTDRVKAESLAALKASPTSLAKTLVDVVEFGLIKTHSKA